jgi:hypothetical protein
VHSRARFLPAVGGLWCCLPDYGKALQKGRLALAKSTVRQALRTVCVLGTCFGFHEGRVSSSLAAKASGPAVVERPSVALEFAQDLLQAGVERPRSACDTHEGWRLLVGMGVACDIVAASLVPVRAGDRVKTDRRDAKKLTLHRGELLRYVQPPTPETEGLRDLLRCRDDLRCTRMAARHSVAKQLLRHGRIYRDGAVGSEHVRQDAALGAEEREPVNAAVAA